MSELDNLQRWVDRYLTKANKEKRNNKMSSKIIDAVKSLNWKDIGVRAAWTFVQAFLAVVLVAIEPIIDLIFKGDWTGSGALVLATTLAGVAAGLSALKTVIVGVVKELKDKSN